MEQQQNIDGAVGTVPLHSDCVGAGEVSGGSAPSIDCEEKYVVRSRRNRSSYVEVQTEYDTKDDAMRFARMLVDSMDLEDSIAHPCQSCEDAAFEYVHHFECMNGIVQVLSINRLEWQLRQERGELR